jgi:hypothetical protein
MRIYPFPTLGLAVGVLSSAALALDIRGYEPIRHDRFVGFPSAPVLNANAWFDASAYCGVGWSVSDPRRQFVLVSPQHFLFAAHWGLQPGEVIRFLAPDGTLHDSVVESSTQVTVNGNGVDLMLGRLSVPVAAETGIKPLPYLHFEDSSSYGNIPLQVFGENAQVGAGSLRGYNNLDPGTGMTWMSYFARMASETGQDDCNFTLGDSGSPTFSLWNGKPALVGTHSMLFTDAQHTFYFNYDSFVPTYVPQLDEMMAADGWRMIPSDAAPTSLAGKASTSPSPLVQAQAGSATFTVQNSSRIPDGNVRVTLTFPKGADPDSIEGDGWVLESGGPLVWTFRRASLPARTGTTLKATWNLVPSVSSMPVGLMIQSDGCAVKEQSFTFSPQLTTTTTKTRRSR